MYKNFGLGHVYATNEYDNSSFAVGDVNVHTTYASYEFKDVLDIQDFGIALGTYYTTVENKTDNMSVFSEDDDFGARVRLTYVF
ncbi:glycoporin [Vibrio sp. JCM 19236]|nr:glycoporin [Vibrio sp. JCM 19236]